MLDQTIENIKQKIRKEIIQPGMDNIPLNYILTRNIPEAIKHFFNQEVEIWLRDEAEKFSSSDRFDYDTPEIQMLVDQIFDNLKQTATFSMNKFNLYWKELLNWKHIICFAPIKPFLNSYSGITYQLLLSKYITP